MTNAERVRASADLLVDAFMRCERGEIDRDALMAQAAEHRKILEGYAKAWKDRTGRKLYIPKTDRRLVSVVVNGVQGQRRYR